MSDNGRLLEREISKAANEELRNSAGPVLREIVDYGIAAFERCSSTAEGLDTPIGIFFPYLLFFELLDGTETLLDAAAAAPARVVLRAAFEALLSFEYVAQKDSERRGAAYVVAEVNRRLGEIDRFDSTTDRGKQFIRLVQQDKLGGGVEIPTIDDLAERRGGLRSMLTEPHLATAAKEYDRVKAKTSRTPAFYALWGGPDTLEQLAAHLGRSGLYEVLYRPWSKTSHGTDLARQLHSLDGGPAISRFRSGEGLHTAYFFSIFFGIEAIRGLLTVYRPDELAPSFRNWYREQIRPTFLRFNSDEDPVSLSI